jgi:hypothetical protein
VNNHHCNRLWNPTSALLCVSFILYVSNPLDHIFTFHPYSVRAGAVLWEACTPDQADQDEPQVTRTLNLFVQYGEAAYYLVGIGYLSYRIWALESTAAVVTGDAVGAGLATTTAVATANSSLAGGAL